MPRFFVRREQIDDKLVRILGEDAHHISRSLRMAAGETVTVCDMQGYEYVCRLTEFHEGEVRAEIESVRASENEPPCYIKLFQALPKGDKMDTVIQKAVECGVGRVIPFESERCVVKLKNEGEDKKTQRRNRIAEEAAKQCGRSVIPEVARTVSFERMLEEAGDSELVLFCYEGDGTLPLGRILSSLESLPKSISVIVGSEGGFSVSEAERCKALGMTMTGLGKRILRTETASGFVLACITCFFELF